MGKLYWFRRQTEPDPTTPKAALRYTGRAEIFRSRVPFDNTTRLIAIVDSVTVAEHMVALANDNFEANETER